MIHTALGREEIVSGERRIVTSIGDKGCVVYGPYDVLRAGRYTVTFDIRLVERTISPDLPACSLDVAADLKIVAERTVYTQELSETSEPLTLAFELERGSICEFRVHASGNVGLSVRYDRTASAVDEARLDWTPVLPRGVESDHPLLREHFADFVKMHDDGWRFEADGADIKAQGPFDFFVESPEDFQLAREIVGSRDYAIVPRRPTIAIDVGMNIGLTSLFLAGRPEIVEIRGYEPFTKPFTRAVRNLAANPELERKITPHHFGLSDRSESLTPHVDAGTIGTSIRGVSGGTPDSIAVRSAADELRPVIERAEAQGFDVFLKLDCEGSEFAIIESLAAAGLLARIDALAIEWHKWWSAEKSQADLIGPLHESGYIVFDRTTAHNPWAGFLYAVRATDRWV